MQQLFFPGVFSTCITRNKFGHPAKKHFQILKWGFHLTLLRLWFVDIQSPTVHTDVDDKKRVWEVIPDPWDRVICLKWKISVDPPPKRVAAQGWMDQHVTLPDAPAEPAEPAEPEAQIWVERDALGDEDLTRLYT